MSAIVVVVVQPTAAIAAEGGDDDYRMHGRAPAELVPTGSDSLMLEPQDVVKPILSSC